MSDDGLPAIFIQNSVIDAYFNSSLLSILLLGLYTTVYVGTMYIYLTTRTSRNWFVVAAVTVLYAVNIGQASVAWYLVKHLLLMISQPRGDVFMLAASGPGWSVLVSVVFTFILSATADGLLIWRCYNVWNDSPRVIVPSLVLLVGEIAIYLSSIIVDSQQRLNPSPELATVLNRLFGAALFISLGTTLLTTVLIAFRIHAVSRQNAANHRNTRPFQNILELLIQSAAFYAAVSLVIAVLSVIPFNPATPSTPWTLYIVQNYINAIFSITAGMAPTIMVARVALASSAKAEPPRTAHISDLEFNGGLTTSETSHTSTNIIYASNVDNLSVPKLEKPHK